MARRRTTGNLRRGVLTAALIIAGTAPVSAQLLPLGGGGGPLLPTGPLLPQVPSAIGHVTSGARKALDTTLDAATTALRDAVGRPANLHDAVQTIGGVRIVRGEVLAIMPDATGLAAARRLGFVLERQDSLSGLGLSIAVLRAPDGMDTQDALAALRTADPQGQFDYNHLYDPSGAEGRPAGAVPQAHAPMTRAASVGMIDAGIDRGHPAFDHAKIDSRCFAGKSATLATAHGTAVASLLIGDDGDFQGFLPGTTLYAADVYCGQGTGGSAEDVARALAWLAQLQVPVVNISLSGPPNALLAAATAAFIAHGHVLVAAVGNDGPAAGALYPAAYPGVVGVTSIDARCHVQIDANQGPDVAFAAFGVDVRAASPHGGYVRVTGTSFAAPAVAARFALLMPAPDHRAALQALATLERDAHALGAPGRNPVFGYGYLAPTDHADLACGGLAKNR